MIFGSFLKRLSENEMIPCVSAEALKIED